MPFNDWRDAVKVLKEATGPSTPEQLKLAKWAGVKIEEYTPRIVTAAQLRVALAKELHLSPDEPVSEQTKFLLGILQQSTGLTSAPANEDEGVAWVKYLRLVQRSRSLEQQRPSSGDVILHR
jgi:hypothetical protein